MSLRSHGWSSLQSAGTCSKHQGVKSTTDTAVAGHVIRGPSAAPSLWEALINPGRAGKCHPLAFISSGTRKIYLWCAFVGRLIRAHEPFRRGGCKCHARRQGQGKEACRAGVQLSCQISADKISCMFHKTLPPAFAVFDVSSLHRVWRHMVSMGITMGILGLIVSSLQKW